MSQELDVQAAATVELFRQKFGKLRRSTVWLAIQANQIRFSLSAEVGEPIRLTVEGPSEEAVDAFVLTLRFFLQNNESISISRLVALIEGLQLEPDLRTRVEEMRTAFNAALDRPCGIRVDSVHPSNRDVLEIFVYGGLAHANQRKRAVFEEWSNQPIVFGVLSQVFYATMVKVLHFLAFLDHTFDEAVRGYRRLT